MLLGQKNGTMPLVQKEGISLFPVVLEVLNPFLLREVMISQIHFDLINDYYEHHHSDIIKALKYKDCA